MRIAAKVDQNQAAIVEYFRKAGFSVAITSSIGKGFPDLVVSYKGITWLIECKMPKGTITAAQSEFLKTWQGGHSFCRSVESAALICEVMRQQSYLLV